MPVSAYCECVCGCMCVCMYGYMYVSVGYNAQLCLQDFSSNFKSNVKNASSTRMALMPVNGYIYKGNNVRNKKKYEVNVIQGM